MILTMPSVVSISNNEALLCCAGYELHHQRFWMRPNPNLIYACPVVESLYKIINNKTNKLRGL
jgi:hypothetical protein